MWFIVPVILLNVLGVLLTFIGQPMFGLALCGLSFLYIAKCFLDYLPRSPLRWGAIPQLRSKPQAASRKPQATSVVTAPYNTNEI